MADVRFDHTIVPARDVRASAEFFSEVFGLPAPVQAGHFLQVRLSDGRLLDFAETSIDFPGPALRVPRRRRPFPGRAPPPNTVGAMESAVDVVRSFYEADGVVVSRLRWTGTVAKDVGPLKAGQQLVAHIAQFVEVADGRIASIETYDCYEPFNQPS